MDILFAILAVLGFVGGVGALALVYTTNLRAQFELDKLRRDLAADLEQQLDIVRNQAFQDVVEYLNNKESELPGHTMMPGSFKGML